MITTNTNFSGIVYKDVDDVTRKSFTYTYDENSNITSDGEKSYTYDELDRLLTADSVLYAYDLVGNRTNFEVNNLNQVVESGNVEYSYDDIGNLSEDDSKKYYYDYRNRLIKVTDLEDNLIVSYEYDVAGHRIKKTLDDGTIIKYVYSGKNVILEQKILNDEDEIILNKEFVYSNKVDDVVAVYVDEVKYTEVDEGLSELDNTEENTGTGETIENNQDETQTGSGSLENSGNESGSGTIEGQGGENSGTGSTINDNSESNSGGQGEGNNSSSGDTSASGSVIEENSEGTSTSSGSNINMEEGDITGSGSNTTTSSGSVTGEEESGSSGGNNTSETGTGNITETGEENNSTSGSGSETSTETNTSENSSGSGSELGDEELGLLQRYFVNNNTLFIANGSEEGESGSGTTETGSIVYEEVITTNLYFYEKNHLGTPVALSNEEGEIVEEYEVDEFGNIVDGLDSELNEIFFTGKFYDREIGLYYFNARYYDSELGRFISRDPIGIVDDVNLYVYVGNNPLKFVDPKGLSKSIVIVVREKIMGASELILKGRIPSIITYISEDVNKYGENSAIMFTLIYEEQSHLFPPIIEDIFKSNTVGLSQISLISQPKDKEYFGFQDNTKSDLLNIEKHLEIMNNRINVIKEKLVEEGREVTPGNIGRAWNGGPECVKQNGTCNKKSISYGDRIEENYPHFLNYNNIITKNKYEYYKNNY